MKIKKLFLFLICISALNASAQKLNQKEVPGKVLHSFSKFEVKAKNVSWEKTDGKYKAWYMQKADSTVLVFDNSGKWHEEDIQIAIAKLPPATLNYINKNYHGQLINGAWKILDYNGVITWKAVLGKMDVFFDTAGNFVYYQEP